MAFLSGVWRRLRPHFTERKLGALLACLFIAMSIWVAATPYDPATDKEFPAWAPAEGDPAAAEYLDSLLRQVPADHP